MNRNMLYTILFIWLAQFLAGAVPCQGQLVLSLEKALDFAMDNSPDIRRTRLDLERSTELLNAQRAALKSNFRLTLDPFSYSSDRTFNRFLSAWSSNETKESMGTFTISQPIEVTGGNISLVNRFSWQDSYSDYQDIRNKQYSNNLYLNFTQPIFTYNQTRLETRDLELNLENTELTYVVQELVLERQVAENYYNAYKSKMNLDIAIEEKKNQEESFQIIKNKVEAGLAALEEQYQAELNLATSRSTVQNYFVTLENNLDNLKHLLGLPIHEMVSLDTDVEYETVDVDLDRALESGLKKRIELRQRKIDIENARNNLIRTSALNEFKGTVTLTYGLIGTNEEFNDIYTKPAERQTVGLSLDIPLWDWGEKQSRIRASEAVIEREQLSYEDETNQITIEIRQTYRRLNNLVNQIDIARQNVRNAQLTYDINLERYQYGDLTSMDLALFQNQLSQKKIDLVSAQVDYRLALLDLKIQSLWDFEKDESVIP